MARRRSLESIPCILAMVVAFMLMGCSSAQDGGAEEPTNDQAGPETGEEDPLATPEPEPEPEPMPEPEPVKRGPGQFRAVLKAGGQPGTGKIRILTADVDPQVITEGPATKTYELEAGEYDVEVTLESVLDHPERRLRDVPIKAGELTEREIDFTVGTIVLQPRRGRSPVRSKVRWRYAGGGDWFESESQTGEELILSCGRYDAEIMLGRTAIVINDIQVYEGRRTVSPAVAMGGRRR